MFDNEEHSKSTTAHMISVFHVYYKNFIIISILWLLTTRIHFSTPLCRSPAGRKIFDPQKQ